MTQQTRSKSSFKVLPNILNLYTDAGLTLIPCAGYAKAIEQKGLFDIAQYDPGLKIKDQNYKMFLDEKFVVIDVDPRNFITPGDKPLARLMKDLHIPPEQIRGTFTVKTPSCGFHFYLGKDPSIKIRHTLKEYPGIDFLSHSVTAAGSYNPDNEKHYNILKGSPMEILPCPDVLLALLAQKDQIDVVAAGLMTDHPANIKHFTDYLSNSDPAIEGQGGDRRTFSVAAMGRDMAISKEKCEELMLEHFNPRCEPPWDMDALLEKISNAYEYGQGAVGSRSIENDFSEIVSEPVEKAPRKIVWQHDKKKDLKLNIANTIQWLYGMSNSILRDTLRFNLLSSRIEFIKDPPWRKTSTDWTDEDAIQCKTYLSVNKWFDVSTATIHDAAVIIASLRSYHPVRDYINALKWDGTPRLNTWLADHCGAKQNDYTSFVGRKTLIGAVSRVYKPGCKFDHVLVFVGEQGTGKSFLCRVLAEPWFTDATLDIRGKDAVEILQGNWIVELGEMDVMSKAESRSLKAFVTRQTDRLRPAYGRIAMDFPRQCIFIGTINPELEGFLKDSTGNRRWWPVDIKQINIALLRKNRDQLWAEAYHYYTKGESCYVDNQAMEKLTRVEAEKFQQEDAWLPIINDWMEKHMFQFYDEKKFQVRVQVADIFSQCLGGNVVTLNAREAVRIATILKQLGYHKVAGSARSTIYVKNLDQII